MITTEKECGLQFGQGKGVICTIVYYPEGLRVKPCFDLGRKFFQYMWRWTQGSVPTTMQYSLLVNAEIKMIPFGISKESKELFDLGSEGCDLVKNRKTIFHVLLLSDWANNRGCIMIRMEEGAEQKKKNLMIE
jgi:hypothetical protein